jgi:hypothetical protein
MWHKMTDVSKDMVCVSDKLKGMGRKLEWPV